MLQNDTYDVCVVGGGASGMMAAYFSALGGKKTAIFEKNEKLGKKLYITGKGRCNFTNSCETEDLFSQVVSNAKFLYSSFYGFTNYDVIDFFEDHGLKTKVERGKRVFPASDKSSDVIKTMKNACEDVGVKVFLETPVADIRVETGTGKKVKGIKLFDGRIIESPKVIIATGGVSYPQTGSDGDRYEFAQKLGHSLIPVKPGLTGLNTKESWTKDLSGLTLTNCEYTFSSINTGKKLRSDFGELLFTHFGVSGPCILSASSKLYNEITKGDVKLSIDLKPSLDEAKLDKRLLREIELAGKKSVKNVLHTLMPSSMTEVAGEISGVDTTKRAIDLTKADRQSLIKFFKKLELHPVSLRSIDEAIITRGGINVKEIEPHTLESRLVKGLFFAGEVIDVDALTGGYNLQIAWSTGALAGRS